MITTIEKLDLFYKKYPHLKGRVKVKTRFGMKRILESGVTAYNSDVIRIKTKCGKSIKTSPDHLMLSNDCKWVKTKKLNINDYLFTEDGPTRITNIKKLKTKENLYDIQVEDVKEYYANGLVSHNSTFLDSITFALFGRPFRKINKPQLVNSINKKDCLVELEFKIGERDYLVRRGLKPNVFEIYQDGNLLPPPAGVKDYQDYFERNILKMNYKAFTQIVILGSSSYIPFMELSAANRRDVIEDLLDLQIFGTMFTLLKTKIQDNKDLIKDLEFKIESNEEKIKIIKDNNSKISKSNSVVLQEKKKEIKETKEKIKNKESEIEKINSAIANLNSGLSDRLKDLNTKVQKLKQAETKLKIKKGNLENEIDFFTSNQSCPTCHQDLLEEHKNKIVCGHQNTLEDVTNNQQKISAHLKTILEKLEKNNKINQAVMTYQNRLSRLNGEYTLLQKNLTSLELEFTKISDRKQELIDNNIISELLSENNECLKEKEVAFKEKMLLDASSALLKDGGIKSKILKRYVPIINQLIGKYLAAFDFFVDFNIDENFNETIRSRFRDDFSYGSFSEGEKFRIDLSIMLAMRAIARMRNSVSTNLLIMDEVADSSLDRSGIEDLFKILNTLTSENITVMLISHRGDEMADMFDNVIKFEKIKNFSEKVDSQ